MIDSSNDDEQANDATTTYHKGFEWVVPLFFVTATLALVTH
jgi:hypothetical protein